MKLAVAQLARGTQIRRPGRPWRAVEAVDLTLSEDMTADDWEVRLPQEFKGGISQAYLHSALKNLLPHTSKRQALDMAEIFLAPLGVTRGALEQIAENISKEMQEER